MSAGLNVLCIQDCGSPEECCLEECGDDEKCALDCNGLRGDVEYDARRAEKVRAFVLVACVFGEIFSFI